MTLSISSSPKSPKFPYHPRSLQTDATLRRPAGFPSNASSTFELLPSAAKPPNDSSSYFRVSSRDGSSVPPSLSPEPPAALERKAPKIESRGRIARDDSVDTHGSSYPHSISSFVRPPRHPESLSKNYGTPSVQLALVSLISFLCPGMWNALNGLGGLSLHPPWPYPFLSPLLFHSHLLPKSNANM